MEVAASDTEIAEDHSTEHQATLDIAERMMEAGTGRRGIPGAEILDLAARVLGADCFDNFNNDDNVVAGDSPHAISVPLTSSPGCWIQAQHSATISSGLDPFSESSRLWGQT